MERKETEARTDIFRFGRVMYEASAGQRAFNGESLESVIGRILKAEPKPVTELKPVRPYTMCLVIRRYLKKDRARRTQTAKTLREELQEVRQEVQVGTVLVDGSKLQGTLPVPIPAWRQSIGM